jgi:hypothetical protein
MPQIERCQIYDWRIVVGVHPDILINRILYPGIAKFFKNI